MKYYLMIIGSFLFHIGMAQNVQDVKSDTSIHKVVDVVPQFSGGFAGWQKFLSNTLDLNETLANMDSTAYAKFGSRQTAILEFTVCTDGTLCDVEVINKNRVSPSFAEETVRVMKMSPKWKPGLKDKVPVRTRFRQNITAVLEE